MERQEFIQLVGRGAVGALLLGCAGCLGSCGSKSSDPAPNAPAPAPTSVDFTIDLSATSSADLQNPARGFIYAGPGSAIIVAKTTAGGYIAVSASCTHQGGTVAFSSGQFVCPNHGSVFGASGDVVQGPATRPLTQYRTTLSGNQLRVQS